MVATVAATVAVQATVVATVAPTAGVEATGVATADVASAATVADMAAHTVAVVATVPVPAMATDGEELVFSDKKLDLRLRQSSALSTIDPIECIGKCVVEGSAGLSIALL